MAVLSFDHYLRINHMVHNIQARVEYQFFGLEPLTTDRSAYGMDRPIKGMTASQLVADLGQDLLPLLDRMNRMVIRNLRMLRELKGGPLSVTVANYGQMNVGQEQTNVATEPRRRAAGRSRPRAQTARRKSEVSGSQEVH